MQALAAALRLRRKIPLLFGEERLKTVCLDSFIFKTGSPTDAQRLLKSFLARNDLVASAFARFLRASQEELPVEEE
jgi:hypothetical protein